jgi:hypothetical protein
MFERLMGKSYYCFLDGYCGYNQIVIAPEEERLLLLTLLVLSCIGECLLVYVMH